MTHKAVRSSWDVGLWGGWLSHAMSKNTETTMLEGPCWVLQSIAQLSSWTAVGIEWQL